MKYFASLYVVRGQVTQRVPALTGKSISQELMCKTGLYGRNTVPDMSGSRQKSKQILLSISVITKMMSTEDESE